MNENNGFIVLSKKMLKWGWYHDNNTKILFIHLLLTANWEEKEWQGIEIKRGQIITSIGHLAQQANLSIQQVRTSLNKLISTNEITKSTTNKYTIITIKNYRKYQDHNKQNNIQITNEQQTNNKQITTTKPRKPYNQENHNNISSSSIYEFVEQNFGRTLNPIEYEELSTWNDTELTRYAVKLAVMNGAVRLNYIKGILNTWKLKNIKTVQEAQKEMEEYKKSKTKKEDQQRRPTKRSAMDRFRETLDNWEKKMEEVENDNKGS